MIKKREGVYFLVVIFHEQFWLCMKCALVRLVIQFGTGNMIVTVTGFDFD